MTTQLQQLFRPGRRGWVARCLFGTLGLALSAVAAQAQLECPAGEEPVRFDPTGAPENYEVPPGVQALRITAAGGEGGEDPGPAVGGLGAMATGIVTVAEGEMLRVLVGMQGGDGLQGGGGGGGSFIGVGTDNDAFSQDNLLVVAGGGGGASINGNGGAGGTPDGGNGVGPGPGGGGGGGGGANGDGGDPGAPPGTGAGGGAMTGDHGANATAFGGGAGGGGAGGNGGNNGPPGNVFAFGGQAAVDGGEGGAGDGDLGGSGGFGGGGGGEVFGGGGGGGYAGGGGGENGFSGAGGGGGSSFLDDERVLDSSVDASNQGDGGVVFCQITQLETDLAIAKMAAVGADGTTVTFDLEVENLGLFNTTGVVVVDTLPACVEFTEDDCDGTEADGEWTWTVDELAAGEAASCQLTVDASGCAGEDEQTNTAEVSSEAQDDPNPDNNTGSAVFEIEPEPEPPTTTFEVETATGTGTASGAISGGGEGCSVASVEALEVTEVAPEGPAGVELPHGLIALELAGCEEGAEVEVALTLPSAIGSEYWKYGPTPDQQEDHWYTVPASVSDTTVTFTIVDGGLGDSDLEANGTIVDPGGPSGVPPVPTLPRLALLMLLALLSLAALRTFRRSNA